MAGRNGLRAPLTLSRQQDFPLSVKTTAYGFGLVISYKVFELLTQTYLNVSGVTALFHGAGRGSTKMFGGRYGQQKLRAANAGRPF
jgi:hypothetical protein